MNTNRIAMVALLALAAGCNAPAVATAPVDTVEAPAPVAPPPPLTDAQIDAVVASAAEAVRLIELSNADIRGADHAATIAAVHKRTAPGIYAALDSNAQRFLVEQPNHESWMRVQNAINRVDGMRFVIASTTRRAEFGAAVDAIDRKGPTATIKYFALLDQYLPAFRTEVETAKAELARVTAQGDAANVKLWTARVATATRIAEGLTGDRKKFRGNFDRESFVANGGVRVTANQLAKDLAANEIRFLAKYKGKRIQITGKIRSIDAGITDLPTVWLKAGGSFLGVMLDGIPLGTAANLDKGQTITATCEGVTEVAGSAALSDCVVAS